MAEGPSRHGLDVGLVGYTLAPEASLTEIAAEIRAALVFLRGLQEGRGRRRLVVSGWSAGGHLAALAMAWPEVDAGLAISGVFDLEPIRYTELDDRLHLTDAEIEALLADPAGAAFGKAPRHRVRIERIARIATAFR